MSSNKYTILTLLCILGTLHKVTAQMDPCQCPMQEFCCGGTSCCFAFYKVWYFWAFILFLVFTFAVMITWLRNRRLQLERTHYVILQGEVAPNFGQKLQFKGDNDVKSGPPPYDY